MGRLVPALQRRIERLAGKSIRAAREIQRGYTPALRLVVTFFDGTSAFVKVATNELTAGWLRREHHVYRSISAPFMPRLLGWNGDGGQPILMLEDLSEADWPPPWNEARVQQVLEALASVATATVPGLPPLENHEDLVRGWDWVAQHPDPFLSLGLASRRWLDSALSRLLEVGNTATLAGQALVHLDVRSDNLCFVEDRAVLVDWNLACIGNPQFDVAFWLPSLEAEGGPPPETILPNAGELAALVSGFFAARAGEPSIPDAPRVRSIQLVQLRSALPWVVRALDLPVLDGERL